jgi:hypothetical protein
MKRIIIILVGLFGLGLTTNAQIHDSTLYRKHNVKSVSQWVHMVAFEQSNDTCLSTVKKISRSGSPTYLKMDYHCQGWDIINEIKYTYDKNNYVVGMTTLQNDKIISELKITVDTFGRILTEENTFFEPSGFVQVKNVYFGDGPNPDSMYSVEVTGEDTVYFLTTHTYANGQLMKSNTIDASSNKAVNMLTNRYDTKGRMTRAEFIYFLGYDNDNITRFEYNEKDQIIKTRSELTDLVAEFYYGLPMKTFYYNKFGSLERELWYKYEYYE